MPSTSFPCVTVIAVAASAPSVGMVQSGEGTTFVPTVSDGAAAVPHVRKRPMQMKRYPNGVDADFFYQKRVPNPHPDWLETVHINYPSGNEVDFPVINDAAGLAWLANLGCIELHTWHSRIG